jgi:hypothetical protein
LWRIDIAAAQALCINRLNCADFSVLVLGGVKAMALEQTIHQQHAPTIGHGIVNRAGQSHLVLWKIFA